MLQELLPAGGDAQREPPLGSAYSSIYQPPTRGRGPSRRESFFRASLAAATRAPDSLGAQATCDCCDPDARFSAGPLAPLIWGTSSPLGFEGNLGFQSPRSPSPVSPCSPRVNLKSGRRGMMVQLRGCGIPRVHSWRGGRGRQHVCHDPDVLPRRAGIRPTRAVPWRFGSDVYLNSGLEASGCSCAAQRLFLQRTLPVSRESAHVDTRKRCGAARQAPDVAWDETSQRFVVANNSNSSSPVWAESKCCPVPERAYQTPKDGPGSSSDGLRCASLR